MSIQIPKRGRKVSILKAEQSCAPQPTFHLFSSDKDILRVWNKYNNGKLLFPNSTYILIVINHKGWAQSKRKDDEGTQNGKQIL